MGILNRLRGSGAPDPTGPPKGAVGHDGETFESYGQILAGGTDINPLLSGRNKYFIYNEMRRSDPAIKSLLWMFKLPIRSALWAVEPSGDGKDATDRRIAEAVERQFGLGDRSGRLDLSWDNSVAQALLELDWGAMGEEKIWAADVEEWIFDDGTTQVIRPLERLAPRSPATVQRIVDDPVTGRITRVEQDIPGASPIPGEKICWYVLEKEGRNWWGTSLLRPCYGPWKLKKGLMIASAIAWDRFAAGVPVVRYPTNGGDLALKQAESIGQNYRTHERAWVALEGPPIKDGGQWDLEILTAQMTDAVPMLRHYDQQIADAGLQAFMRLGTTETGSRAVGQVLGVPFYMAVQGIADDIADLRQKDAIREFVAVNFGTDKDVPTLTVSKIGEQPIELLAAALANLSSAGFYFKDPDTQNDVRDRLDFGHLPDDYVKMLEDTMGQLPATVGIGLAGEPAPPPEQKPPPTKEGSGLGL